MTICGIKLKPKFTCTGIRLLSGPVVAGGTLSKRPLHLQLQMKLRKKIMQKLGLAGGEALVTQGLWFLTRIKEKDLASLSQ